MLSVSKNVRVSLLAAVLRYSGWTTTGDDVEGLGYGIKSFTICYYKHWKQNQLWWYSKKGKKKIKNILNKLLPSSSAADLANL